MPTYEYKCPRGHQFERFQKMSDPPEADCPECGRASERLLSGGAGFLFKGEGFYVTDYRSDDYKKKAAAEKGGSDSAKKDSGSGNESGSTAGKAESKSSDGAGSSGKKSSGVAGSGSSEG